MTNKKSIKVIGFGTFDGLHPGHLSYIKQLRNLGDEVCVIVARDCNVKNLKCRLPRYDEKNRMKEIKDTSLADHVLLGDKNDFYKCISDYSPDIIGLGYDQRADIDELKKIFPEIEIKRLEAFEPERNKSSLLK